MSVSIARSRTPSGVCPSGAASRRSTCVRVRYFGRGRPSRGALTSETGDAATAPRARGTGRRSAASKRAGRWSGPRAPGPQGSEVVEEIGAGERPCVGPAVREEGGEAAQVGAVRRQRVTRETPLRLQVEQKGVEEGVVVHQPVPGRGISTIRGSIVSRSTIAHVFFPRMRPHDSPGFTTSAFPTRIVSGRCVWPKRTRSNRPCPESSPCSWS